MKESMTEQLSRFIDGDLDPTELAELEACLAADPELRRELDGLLRVRASLRSYAKSEEPPPALDALVDPLLRGKPAPITTRPWARWLATAAVLVLGVTVILELQRREPVQDVRNWQEKARQDASEPGERFSLAPLPTSAVPEEERPVGAADRLVAAPEPEIETSTEAPPPLEVLGPLETDASSEGKGRREKGETGRETDGLVKSRAEATQLADQAARELSAGETAKRSSEAPAPSSPSHEGPPRTRSLWSTAKPAVTEAQLFIFMDASTAWRSFEPRGPCEAGRYSVRIKVQDGVVREVWPVASQPAPTRQVRASQLILGLEIEDVPDGEYSAEVVVEPPRPAGS